MSETGARIRGMLRRPKSPSVGKRLGQDHSVTTELIENAAPPTDANRVEPDTSLHQMQGPEQPTPAWVRSAWERAAAQSQG
jgi:hypothetical protein